MKPLIIILATFTIILNVHIEVDAQCCPYIDSVSIYPENPTSADSIYLLTVVTTPNLGWLMESGFIIEEDYIKFETCYFEGNYTVLTTHDIEFNLGLLSAGEYDLDFIAYNSNIPDYCLKDDTSTVSVNFIVDEYLKVEDPKEANGICVSPNPAKNFITIENYNPGIGELEIFTLTGKTSKRTSFTNNQKINVSELTPGIYILKFEQDGQQIVKKLIKE